MSAISHIEIYKLDIPFRIMFRHSLKARRFSESIFTRVSLKDGTTGVGESMPRDYVTGRTQDMVFRDLIAFCPKCIGVELKNLNESLAFVENLSGIEGEGRCALEIALLDCIGRLFNKPVCELLARPITSRFIYTGAVFGDSPASVAFACALLKWQRYKYVKMKVGLANDLARLRTCRFILRDADLRVDANGAWGRDEAIREIEKFRRYNISCIEQPTPKNDIAALKGVADACPEPVIADESLCTTDDALLLTRERACDIFNVRLSKCGGMHRSLQIIKIAQDNKIGYQIGCHVGETGVLCAAARHLASVLVSPKYLESSFSRFLLKEDVITQDLTPKKGIAYGVGGPGLGVEIKEDVLKKYSKKFYTVA